jgi:hypothetical protein
MYKGIRAMDPMKIVSTSKKSLVGKARSMFMANVATTRRELENSLQSGGKPFKLDAMKLSSELKVIEPKTKSFF